jgi:hypothetical protein
MRQRFRRENSGERREIAMTRGRKAVTRPERQGE